MSIWRMRIACWITKTTDTLIILNTQFFHNDGYANAPHYYVSFLFKVRFRFLKKPTILQNFLGDFLQLARWWLKRESDKRVLYETGQRFINHAVSDRCVTEFDPWNPCWCLPSSSVAVRSMPRLRTKHPHSCRPLKWSSAVPPRPLFDVASPLHIFSSFLITDSSHNLSFYTPLLLVAWTSLFFSDWAGVATRYSNWETGWTTGQIDSTERCLSKLQNVQTSSGTCSLLWRGCGGHRKQSNCRS